MKKHCVFGPKLKIDLSIFKQSDSSLKENPINVCLTCKRNRQLKKNF